jgi:hypothetical protein
MEKFIVGVIGFMIGCIATCGVVLGMSIVRGPDKDIKVLETSYDEYKTLIGYDPNDPIYKFIPEAPKDWRDKFGTSERTRLMHSISELRVVVAAQGQILTDLKKDPNEIN